MAQLVCRPRQLGLWQPEGPRHSAGVPQLLRWVLAMAPHDLSTSMVMGRTVSVQGRPMFRL